MKDKAFNDPCMQAEVNLMNEDKDNVVAMFVMALIQGETLASKMIRPGTMRGYFAAFLRLFHLRKITDPTKDVVANNAWKAVELFEKWQKLPKRREPLSDSICEFLIDLGLADPNQDGLDAVIADWLIIGRYLAFRLYQNLLRTPSQGLRSIARRKEVMVHPRHSHLMMSTFLPQNLLAGRCPPKPLLLEPWMA